MNHCLALTDAFEIELFGICTCYRDRCGMALNGTGCTLLLCLYLGDYQVGIHGPDKRSYLVQPPFHMQKLASSMIALFLFVC